MRARRTSFWPVEGERITVSSCLFSCSSESSRVQDWFCPSHAADNAQIADELHTSRVTVGMWRQRFVDLSIECLEEAP